MARRKTRTHPSLMRQTRRFRVARRNPGRSGEIRNMRLSARHPPHPGEGKEKDYGRTPAPSKEQGPASRWLFDNRNMESAVGRGEAQLIGETRLTAIRHTP